MTQTICGICPIREIRDWLFSFYRYSESVTAVPLEDEPSWKLHVLLDQLFSNVIPDAGDFLAALARAVYHIVLPDEVAHATDE